MTTSMRLLPVRVSAPVRHLIDQVGAVNPATRALLLLGAARAGLDLRGLDRELAIVLAAGLAPEVQTALREVFDQVHAATRTEQAPVHSHARQASSACTGCTALVPEAHAYATERSTGTAPTKQAQAGGPWLSSELVADPAPTTDPPPARADAGADPFAMVGIDV
ncbi:hypothetical protein EYB53_010740 [Candidatus Chloroploca sp. M-50]|uniref:Uncharacterized protein n=1 Tax=Candidatus Chloroploca mongolica TaxID=2528176 RepID=A0ABS4D9S5_9CHLR|nr:hypothetical protein [Candidatus Chloroploca mongolica]MBP1466182.1 hypothetical protein [Candidatus Chloroploca mongolica]